MARRSTRCGKGRGPDGPAGTNDTTRESLRGHSTLKAVLGHAKGIWPWDLNRMLDAGFGWSRRLRSAAIPSWLMNWLVLERKKRCRRYRAWTWLAQSRAALIVAPPKPARVAATGCARSIVPVGISRRA